MIRTAGEAWGLRQEISGSSFSVLHVGPDSASQGGMASVIQDLVRNQPCGLSRAYSTWRPGAPIYSVARTLLLVMLLSTRIIKPGVVHVHLSEGGSFVREGLLVGIGCRLSSIPMVATLHGADFTEYAAKHPKLVRRVLDGCEQVACLGLHSQRTVHQLMRDTRVSIVRNPVPDERIRVFPSVAQESPERPFTVLFAGEAGRRKGIDRLLAAWETVIETEPSAKLVACGPAASDYQIPDAEQFEYRGTVSRDDVLDLLDQCDLAVLPSRAEALPMFVLEAAGRGVPVLVSNAGEMDSLQDCPGITVIQQTDSFVEDLARAIVVQIQASDAARVPRNLITRWTQDNCAASVVAQKYMALYDACDPGKAVAS